jgi:hypothetical protein
MIHNSNPGSRSPQTHQTTQHQRDLVTLRSDVAPESHKIALLDRAGVRFAGYRLLVRVLQSGQSPKLAALLSQPAQTAPIDSQTPPAGHHHWLTVAETAASNSQNPPAGQHRWLAVAESAVSDSRRGGWWGGGCSGGAGADGCVQDSGGRHGVREAVRVEVQAAGQPGDG